MKTRCLILCILTCIVGSTTLAQLEIKFEKYTLPNGLQVILHEDHSVPVVAVNIWYHVGASREKPGRSGFAHLFEHLMYEGSEHVPDGVYDQVIDGSGGTNNGSTGFDRTNYWVLVPKNYTESAFWLESDRMGFLLPGITQERLDLQRDVVKNERRQSYENQPYGMAFMKIMDALYPDGIPYHWLPIGSQEDLSAASLEDVKDFFRKWYSTKNASLCIGGDFEPAQMKKLVEKYFSDIPAGGEVPKLEPLPRDMKEIKKLVIEDRVQLPRLYMVWHSPAIFQPDDAAMDILSSILSGGKNSRLYKTMVYEKQIAQDVSAFQGSAELSSYFGIIATASPGHNLNELHAEINAELQKLMNEEPSQRELDRAKNGIRANFIYQLQNLGGFGGKTDQLNSYNTQLGDPGKFNWDLNRYVQISRSDIKRVAHSYLNDKGHVILSIVPQGKLDLQLKP